MTHSRRWGRLKMVFWGVKQDCRVRRGLRLGSSLTLMCKCSVLHFHCSTNIILYIYYFLQHSALVLSAKVCHYYFSIFYLSDICLQMMSHVLRWFREMWFVFHNWMFAEYGSIYYSQVRNMYLWALLSFEGNVHSCIIACTTSCSVRVRITIVIHM